MGLKLDDWQKQVLNAKGDICVCAGRQTGKSTIISIKAAEFMVKNKGKQVLIVSTTEDQSQLMIVKILDYLLTNHKTYIKKGKDRPTKHEIKLNNGSKVRCKAVGVGGVSIRGFTIDMIIVDEAAFMPENVWAALTPMLLTTGGQLILISTPFGRSGYFYECYHNPQFATFHVNSVEVMKERPISDSWTELHRANALARLETERDRMSENQFAQEYLGQFINDLAQFFPDELIIKCMKTDPHNKRARRERAKYYLGVDVARLGEDENRFEIVEVAEQHIYHVGDETMKKVLLPNVTDKILMMDSLWNFRKIYIDDGGIGVGVFDYLLTNEQTKRRVVPINNAKRMLDDDKRTKKLLKEDLYNNLLSLMQHGKIDLLKSSDVYNSLKSVQYEYTNDKQGNPYLRIFSSPHKFSHLVEALIRAVWGIKDKSLNMFITYI